MATSSPNSFLDPYWSDLAARAAKRNDVPPDLLVSILTKGERSNADQVSEADARTPFQVTKKTRDLVLKRDGVDAFLSDDNAADVAAKVLKDGLNFAKNRAETPEDRNALAAGFYHSGGDFKDWGPRTKSYVQRVTGGIPAAAPVQSSPAAPQQSTFERVSAQQNAQPSSSMANVLKAYQSGQMSPEDATAFEGAVNAGQVMLPRGVTLKGAEAATAELPKLPSGAAEAYLAGRMDPKDMEAVNAAVNAGTLALPSRAAIPGAEQSEAALAQERLSPTPGPTIGEQAIGAGETALAVGTGLVGGPVGAVRGGVQGLMDPNVTNIRQLEQSVQQGAEALTYAPRTEAGQAQTAAVGRAAQNLIPISPLAPQIAGLQRAGQAARPTAQVLQQTVPQVARETAATAAQNVAAGARAIPERVGQALGRQPAAPTPGTMGSAGAAATDIATQRQQLGQNLPIPIEQSRGQLTREPGQMRFESEVAKQSGKPGETLREFTAEQNQRVARNFDALIDQTESQKTNMLETGRAVVDEGLKKIADRSKAEYNVKFRKAREAGEMEDPTSMEGLANVLNESVSAEGNAPIIGATRKELQRLGGASMDEQGRIVGGELTLNQAEELRKFINKTMNTEGADLNYAPQLRSAIDAATEGLGGELYKDARKAYQRHAQLFKDNAIVKSLLDTKKGTSDRRVALEDVFQKTILNGSREDLSMLRRTLQVGKSAEGIQAWKELQGATLRHLAEEANAFGTVSNATDVRGNPIIQSNRLNNAVSAMEEGNKLDFVLGKQQAQMVRDLNELTKLVKTAPPGTINTSNTAATILGAIAEAGATGAATGLPLPVISVLRALSKNVKDRKLQAKVNEAIGRQAAANAKPRAKVKPIEIKKP